jgi:hypothetical protein
MLRCLQFLKRRFLKVRCKYRIIYK